MTNTHARGLVSTTTAFGSVALMLTVARNAGLEGAAPIGLIMVAGAVMLGIVLMAIVLHVLRDRTPREQLARLLLETMGMLCVATPVVFVASLYAGWL